MCHQGRLNYYGDYPGPDLHVATLGTRAASKEATRLVGDGEIALAVTLHYRVSEAPARRERWAVTVAAYWFTLYDAILREIIAYHWQPGGRSPVTTPHLHLGADAAAVLCAPGYAHGQVRAAGLVQVGAAKDTHPDAAQGTVAPVVPAVLACGALSSCEDGVWPLRSPCA